MSVKDDLIGAKGGSSTFRSRPDNLRSTDTFEALIGLASGRIKGFAPGGLKNLFVDDVPIEDGSGNTTLKDFNAVLFDGDPAILEPIKLQLGGSSGAQTVNLPINNSNQADGTSTPGEWRFATVPQAGVDYIDIRLVVNSLYRQDKKGIYDETASFEVELQPSGSSQWINPLSSTSAPAYNANGIKLSSGYSLYALQDNWSDSTTWYDPAPGYLQITGKTTQAYVKELRVAVPNTGTYANKTWQVRIRLRERDSYTQDENQEFRAVTWESVAGVSMAPIGNREEWRGLSYLQVNGKASDQLTGIPTITGIYDLSMVRVPPASVWNAETRVYTGATWDGATEEIQWTQCPAFQMKDLIEDDISGISALTPGSTLNKWDTLEASKWFAQLVPDGSGGTHPRYSMNYLLDSALSVNDLMQYVAGAVGSYAWDEGDGNWRLVVEKPENATALFTKESIVGEFNYSHTDLDGRFNDMIGVFRNESRGFEEDRVRVFDQSHIDNYGRRATSLALVGCTTRQEALRRIKIRQLSSLQETRQVSFVTNRQGSMVQPFSVILVADGDLASDTLLRTTGRLVGRSDNTLLLRDTIRLEVGITYKVHVTVPNPAYTPDTTAQPGSADWRKPTITITRNVLNQFADRGDVKSIAIDAPLPANTPPNAQVALEAVGLPSLPKQYRVLEVEPQDEELISITAIEVYTNKWNESDNVDEDAILAQRPNKVIPAPLTPIDGAMFSVKYYTAEFQTKRVLTVRWDRPGSIWISGFKVEYNLNNGPWVTLTGNTQDSYVELQQPQNGSYTFRITTIDRRGGSSTPLLGTYQLVDTAEDYAPANDRGPLADRPPTGQRKGDRYTTTDQNPNLTYIWTGVQWVEESNYVDHADQITYLPTSPGVPVQTVQDLKPAEPGATNSGDPNSPFGPVKTVGNILDTVNDLNQDLTDAHNLISAAQANLDKIANVQIKDILDRESLRQYTNARVYLLGQPIGVVVQHNEARSVAADTVFAQNFDLFGARSLDGFSWILDIDTVRVSPTQSLAERFSSIDANIGDNESEIQNVSQAVVTLASSTATQFQAVSSRFDSNEATVTNLNQTVVNLTSSTATQFQQVSSRFDTNEATVGNLTQTVTTLSSSTASTFESINSRFGTNETNISNLQTAYSSLSSSTATSISSLTTRVGAAEGSITTIQSSVSDLNSSLSSLAISVSSQFGSTNATVSSLQEAFSGPNGSYGKSLNLIDINGHITGTYNTNNGTTSNYTVVAEVFSIIDPNGGSPFSPFTISGGVVKMHSVEVDTIKADSIDSPALKQAAAAKTSFTYTSSEVACPYNVPTTVASYTTRKEDADSILKIMVYAQCRNNNDLQFNVNILMDGNIIQNAKVNMIFDDTNSAGAVPITIFALLAGVSSGDHDISFNLNSYDNTNGTTYVQAGAYIEVTELRKPTIGNSSGTGAPTYTPGGGTPGGDYGGGDGGGGYCVTIDTNILMADGTEKPASQLMKGDWVRTQHQTTKNWGDYKVERVEFARQKVYLVTIGENSLRATADHLIWVNDRWTRMHELGTEDGMDLIAKITVESARTYISNGILSHNIKADIP